MPEPHFPHSAHRPRPAISRSDIPRRRPAVLFGIALCLAIGIVGSAIALFGSTARADLLENASDTLSDSNIGAIATHTILYTTDTSTLSGQTVIVTFDPVGNQFDGVQNVTFGNLQFIGRTLVSSLGSCTVPTTDEIYFTSTSTAPGDESVTFTVCPTDTLAAGSGTIVIANRIVNPTSTGSYVVRIGGTQADFQNTVVAVLPNVQLTASVDTVFTFTVTGVATGTDVNGVTTTRASTETALNFGTLPVNSPVTLGQQLTVLTNARNGFVVSVFEDQNPQNVTGDDINLFENGNATATPSTWVAPAGTVGQRNTYGHFGLTSDDGDLNGNEFGTGLFAGNFWSTTTRQVFSATGSADGLTPNIGSTTVAYRIQIGNMQEPGSYSNRITYIATPTF